VRPPQEFEARYAALPPEATLDVLSMVRAGVSWEEAIAKVEAHLRAQSATKKKKASKAQGREVCFEDVEPWGIEVEGPALLADIRGVFLRYLALPEGAVEALTLWTVHAHAHDLCEVSPLLVLKSPAPRCGKTSALRLLGRLVPRPLRAGNITVSAAFRAVEKYRPTLLVDEVDAFMRDNEELRGLLNNGHERENATFLRIVGESLEPRAFSTWAPKAIASIGSLAATLEDRAVTIPMRRKARVERVERMRLDRLSYLEPLRQKIARWVGDHETGLRDADPPVPETLDDRAADNWRPLLAVADEAGGVWPARARDAAILLSLGRSDEAGHREQLLADIRTVWAENGKDRLPSVDMVAALVAMKERPWGEIFRGRPLTPNGLARLLSGFGIAPKNVRTEAGVYKGYLRADFADASQRYLPNLPVAAVGWTVAGDVADEILPNATLFPAPGLECSGVADETPGEADEGHGDAWEGSGEEVQS